MRTHQAFPEFAVDIGVEIAEFRGHCVFAFSIAWIELSHLGVKLSLSGLLIVSLQNSRKWSI